MPRPATRASSEGGVPAGRRTRRPCFEWLRAFGCAAIVALHVYTTLWEAGGRGSFRPLRACVEGYLSIVVGRWAVPAFLMVSGALLLDPAKNVGPKRIRRYMGRMLFVLATFGLLFCLAESFYNHRVFTLAVVGEALLNLVTAHSWGHLWYVYALLGLYALTPVLRQLTAREERAAVERALLLLYALVLVPLTVLHLMRHTLHLPVNLLPSAFYFLLGWYAWRYLRLDVKTVGLGAASLAVLFACQLLDHGEMALPEYCLVAPYGVLAFLLFKRFATSPVSRYPLVARLANRSFGIYVVHPVFLHVLVRAFDVASLPTGVYELCAFALALGGSYVAVGLVRRIPGFAGRI